LSLAREAVDRAIQDHQAVKNAPVLTEKPGLLGFEVRLIMFDIKILTMRELNRKTASVLDRSNAAGSDLIRTTCGG